MVLFVHDHKFIYYASNYYSEGKFTNQVFTRYDPFKSNISVVCRKVINSDSKQLNLIDNKNVVFNPVKGLSFSKVFSKFLIFNLILIFKQVKKSDCLVVRLPSILGVFVLLVNLIFRKKYFVEFVGDPKESLLTSRKKISVAFAFFTYMLAALNKFFVKHADGVIYVTKYDLQKRYPNIKLSASASNVQVNVEVLDLKISDFSKKYECFTKIGLIGSFNNEYKGIDIALKCLFLLKENGEVAHLHILGSGKLKLQFLEQANKLGISDQIFFDGSLAGGKEVADWLKQLDLYIQPSLTEGLPRALIEAMSVGLPAIASNVGGIPELLGEDSLILAGDHRALAEKILILINSQQIRFDKGVENYKTALGYDAKELDIQRSVFWKKAAEMMNDSIK